jgi:nucleoside-diphosphate-sugar epimerase
MKTVVVAGAVGVIGRGVLAHFDDRRDARVVGLSRRSPDFPTRAEHISVDLMNPADCENKLGGLNDVTHLVYAAYQEFPSLSALVAPNLAMLRNFIETVERSSPGLRHVTLMQGGKAYGCHLGPFPTPAREDDPRHMGPNFYYDQEDFLGVRSQGKEWTWTALRPEAVIGIAVGNPMNLLMVIAVYASIARALGLPLTFPGSEASYRALYQVTDARILASATEWAGQTDAARGQVYNITNGDYFRWSRIWPRIASFFNMQAGDPLPFSLREMMADKGPVWEGIVKTHGLRSYRYEQTASWGFGDTILKTPYDNITSTIKARHDGFHDCIDTEQMFLERFEQLIAAKVIPP